jgi:hypothetical protein
MLRDYLLRHPEFEDLIRIVASSDGEPTEPERSTISRGQRYRFGDVGCEYDTTSGK